MKRIDNTRCVVAARQIECAMARRGMSRSELARKMGRQPSEVTKWLSGSHNFTINLLAELSDVLGCEITGVGGKDSSYSYKCIDNVVEPMLLNDSAMLRTVKVELPYAVYESLAEKAQASGQSASEYIEKLIVNNTPRKPEIWDFFGSWPAESDEEVEDMISMIYSSRTSKNSFEL